MIEDRANTSLIHSGIVMIFIYICIYKHVGRRYLGIVHGLYCNSTVAIYSSLYGIKCESGVGG